MDAFTKEIVQRHRVNGDLVFTQEKGDDGVIDTTAQVIAS
jgi:hypothetical protein